MAQVSIIIRAKNEEKLLGLCLDGIFSQRANLDFKVLLIDSGSTDATLEIARNYSRVRIHQIDADEFNYGETLNLGLNLVDAEFAILLSAHCVPVDDTWLQQLIDPLLSDETLAATFSRQIPWPDCPLYERFQIEEVFNLPPYVQRECSSQECFFDTVFSNASSCVRRSLALDTPFRPLAFAEDRVWASEMLRNGFGVAYVPSSVVYHSHPWTAFGRFRAAYLMGKAMTQMGVSVPYRELRRWLRVNHIWKAWRTWSRFGEGIHRALPRRVLASLAALYDDFMYEAGMWRARRQASRLTEMPICAQAESLKQQA